MKAEDLMVGDYLMHNGFPYRVIQVDGIVRDGWMIENGEEDCGKPIPLTPEILEKNGFVNVENTQTSTIIYSFRDSLFRIEVYDFNHITIDSYYTDSSCDLFISSIHELQHAIRLCGIKKEIIL